MMDLKAPPEKSADSAAPTGGDRLAFGDARPAQDLVRSRVGSGIAALGCVLGAGGPAVCAASADHQAVKRSSA